MLGSIRQQVRPGKYRRRMAMNQAIQMFLKVFRGQDYCNMNFGETLNWKLRGGVEFTQDRFFTYN
jgi:hypothetical protein